MSEFNFSDSDNSGWSCDKRLVVRNGDGVIESGDGLVEGTGDWRYGFC